MAADIRRSLQHEPILAGPATSIYRLQQYIIWHWLGVAIATWIVLLTVGLAIFKTVQLNKITRERDRADRLTTFLTDIFRASSPLEARGKSVTARELLDRASEHINGGLTKNPEPFAVMLGKAGATHSQQS
jgi:hypothetical protein